MSMLIGLPRSRPVLRPTPPYPPSRRGGGSDDDGAGQVPNRVHLLVSGFVSLGRAACEPAFRGRRYPGPPLACPEPCCTYRLLPLDAYQATGRGGTLTPSSVPACDISRGTGLSQTLAGLPGASAVFLVLALLNSSEPLLATTARASLGLQPRQAGLADEQQRRRRPVPVTGRAHEVVLREHSPHLQGMSSSSGNSTSVTTL